MIVQSPVGNSKGSKAVLVPMTSADVDDARNTRIFEMVIPEPRTTRNEDFIIYEVLRCSIWGGCLVADCEIRY